MDLLSSNHCSVAIGQGVEIRYFVTILSSLYPFFFSWIFSKGGHVVTRYVPLVIVDSS